MVGFHRSGSCVPPIWRSCRRSWPELNDLKRGRELQFPPSLPRNQEQAKNVMLGLPNGTSEVYSGASIEKSHAKSAGHPSISHPKFSQWISSLQQRGRIPTGRRKHHRTNSSLLKGFGFCKQSDHCAERIRELSLEPIHLGSFALLV